MVTLGKILGIGGVGLGTFFLLFEKLLGQKILPMVEPRQVSQFVLLIYAIAALALIGYLAKETTRRYIPALGLVFAGLMGWWSTTLLHSGTDSPVYRVRVIVIGPNRIPVNDAHVWCTLGGVTNKIDGGWEIVIPREPSEKKQEGKIWAEVAAQGLRGDSALTLGEGAAPPITVDLRKVGELPVRGIVVDGRGNAVGNAIVSVVGYGSETMPTNVNGGFELPSHAEQGETISLHAERPPYLPAEMPEYKGWC